MALKEVVPSLMSFPLEVRHSIFEHLSARESKPRKLMRYWFEKEEAESLIKAYTLHNPSKPAPIVLYSDNDCDTERESVINETFEEDTDNGHAKEDGEQEKQDTEGNKDTEDAENTDADEYQKGDENNKSETVGNYGNAENFLPLPPVIRPNKSWRHIPHFLRLTHCLPPAELFLVSRQLNTEAKNWYYDMAVLRINATGSFAYTNFFEQAMLVLSETTAFSPLDNIRKAEVTFVWDTTWIRKDTAVDSQKVLFDVLRKRGTVIRRALTRATELREVVIHWHDSAQDSEAANLRNDILEPFNALSATIKVEEHYISPDAEPKKRSVAGKRRLEFENIYYWGLDHAS